MNRFIEWDNDVWEIIGTGAEREKTTFCHLASLTRFHKQENGPVPVQIQDHVFTDQVRTCQQVWKVVEIILYLRMVAGYPPQQSGELHDLTDEQRYRILHALRDELAERGIENIQRRIDKAATLDNAQQYQLEQDKRRFCMDLLNLSFKEPGADEAVETLEGKLDDINDKIAQGETHA